MMTNIEKVVQLIFTKNSDEVQTVQNNENM